jgi:hypothetical protein
MSVAEFVAAGLIIALVVAAALLTWGRRHRPQADPISEAQARANAAPLTTAILGSDHRTPRGP